MSAPGVSSWATTIRAPYQKTNTAAPNTAKNASPKKPVARLMCWYASPNARPMLLR